MDDRELNQLLRQWQAPDAPPHLRPPARPPREPWWQWFVSGTVRVPVPVGLAAAVVLATAWSYSSAPREPVVETQPAVNQPVVSLADFQPVQDVELRVIGEVR